MQVFMGALFYGHRKKRTEKCQNGGLVCYKIQPGKRTTERFYSIQGILCAIALFIWSFYFVWLELSRYSLCHQRT